MFWKGRGKHEHFVVQSEGFSVGGASCLQAIIESNCLWILVLEINCYEDNGYISWCMEYLQQGFVNLSKISATESIKLEELSMDTHDEVPLDFIAAIGRQEFVDIQV